MYYCRTLKEVKCKTCGYTTFDAYVEDYKINETSHNSYEANVHMICPKCKDVDKFEFLSLPNEEATSVSENEHTQEYCSKKNGNCIKYSDNSCDICDFKDD